ncbi:MAG TPA: hypothetical protein VHZ24_09870 [Pirellulales bacterium]|jgi:hypothetical protein|nr:hypothetical protein [Pirellulales bacterium]
MKKLMVLTALAVLSAASVGCSLFNRGQSCNSCGPGGQDAYLAAPSAAPVMSGGTTYVPGPVQ